MHRRVGIVYPRANLDTVPSLIGAAEQLAEAGFDVDVFTLRQAGQPDTEFDSPRIRLRSLGVDGLADYSTASLRGAVKRVGWIPSVARAPLLRTYNVLGAGLAGGTRLAARARSAAENVLWDTRQAAALLAQTVTEVRPTATCAKNRLVSRTSRAVAEREAPYTCVIGVDPDGLALAQRLARGAPLGYYSLELLLSYELNTPTERQLKAQERALSQQAAFVIVQDEERGRLLADDNRLDWSRVVLVPNAPAGPARRQAGRYWHARFDLPDDARVVIHSGSLGDWTGIEAIVDSASDWPAGWILVIHTRFDAHSSAYVEDLRARADPRHVYFSLKPVPRQEYDPLIDGADVGLAFYVPQSGSAFTQRNVQAIGLSSGKLAYYLRAGLPVIVNRASSIAEVVDGEGLGVSVPDAQGIHAALQSLSSPEAYARCSAGALQFFDRHLDFNRAFGEVICRLDALQ